MSLTGSDTDNLIAQRDAAAQAYYEGTPIMSDEEFDALSLALEAAGVAEEVGHGFSPTGAKVAHPSKMLSLRKVRTDDEVDSWLSKMTSAEPNVRFLMEPKFDGLALIITFNPDGTLKVAATRGNGQVGEDITHTVSAMMSSQALPATVPVSDSDTVVIGEVYMTRHYLAVLNDAQKAAGLPLYQNPRNAAAGLLRRHSTEDAHHLSFVAYETNKRASDEDGTDLTATQLLESWGFETPLKHEPLTIVEADKVRETVDRLGAIQQNFDFDTDGVVIKVHAPVSVRERIGLSTSSPRWAVAFKFASEEVDTTVRNVEWNLTRTGRLVPVVIFAPVLLAGATVTRATLHNFGFFADLNLRAGDTIKVKRSNEVIPYVVGKVASGEGKSFVAPTHWPLGSTEGSNRTSLGATRIDLLAPAGATNVAESIEYSLKTLDVKGVGGSVIADLLDAGTVAEFLDLPAVTAEQIMALDGYGNSATKAKNYVAAIATVFSQPLEKWIAAMGMKMIANTKSPILAQRFGSLDALATASAASINDLDGFGGAKTQSVIDNQDRIAAWASRLRDEYNFVPVNPAPKEVQASRGGIDYNGKKVVVTGTFPTMSRKDVEQWVKDHGGSISSSVSASTDLLVAGEKAGSKLAKAQAAGVQVVTAEEFEENV